MKFSQFGAKNGQLVIYFHGVPGAPEECKIFDSYGKIHDLTFICFDRFYVCSKIQGESYYKYLAEQILKIAPGKQVDIIGFSIGAFIAIQISRYIPQSVKSLHLVSPAAPLEGDNFLESMAGKHIFKLAKRFNLIFVALSYWQKLLAMLFPKMLFNLLFASAIAGDKVLVQDPQFKTNLGQVLISSFRAPITGYVRDIKAYVNPWENSLSEISVETKIWHGSHDNWSPRAMADYLKSKIPSCTGYNIFSGLSHYSTLYHSAPLLCVHLSKKMQF